PSPSAAIACAHQRLAVWIGSVWVVATRSRTPAASTNHVRAAVVTPVTRSPARPAAPSSVAALTGPHRRRRGGALARLAGTEVEDDRLGGRRADPGDAQLHDREQRVERADASRGLDLDMGRGVGAHQAQVVMRRPGRREAGAGLDEVATGGLREVAGPDLLVVGEVGVLEDHLDDRAAG